MNILDFWNGSFWNWWVLGLVIALLEIFVPGVLFLWFGLAAFVVGLVVLVAPATGWEVQVLLFAALGLAMALASRRFFAHKPLASDDPTLNRRAEQYIGRIAVLDDPILNGRGRVRLGDTHWAVEGPDMAGGLPVEIIGVSGTVLRVKPAPVSKSAP